AVVVPLVARPLVTWMTSTPPSAHSHAAMVPAAPPPMMRTSVSCRLSGTSSRIGLLCFLLFVVSGVSDHEKCVDTSVGKCVVVDVQRHLLDRRRRQVTFERIDKYSVVARDFPRPLVVAFEIPCAALGMLAEAPDWNEN